MVRRSKLGLASFIAALVGVMSAGGVSADIDSDGVADEVDNCRYFANPSQADNGGVVTTAPDGIGDACQCGDVSDDGIVTDVDSNAIKSYGLGVPNANFVVIAKCDVTGNGLCNGQDANATLREVVGGSPNPLFRYRCAPQRLSFSTTLRGEPAAPLANGTMTVLLSDHSLDDITLTIPSGLTASSIYTVFITESPLIGALPAVFLGQFSSDANGAGTFSVNAEIGDAHSPANQSQESASGVGGQFSGDSSAGANTIPLNWIRVYQEGANRVNVFGVKEDKMDVTGGKGGGHITTSVDPLP